MVPPLSRAKAIATGKEGAAMRPAASPPSMTLRLRAWIAGVDPMSLFLLALIVFIGMTVYGLPHSQASLHLSMRTTAGKKGEVFYRQAPAGFIQADSAPFSIIDDGNWHDYVIDLPTDQRIDHIRIDPAIQPGALKIRSLEVRDGSRAQKYSGRRFYDSLGRINQLHAQVDQDQNVSIYAMGNDPYLEIVLDRPVGAARLRTFALRILAAFAVALLLAGFKTALDKAWKIWRLRTKSPTGLALTRYTNDELLQFTPPILLTFLSILFAAAVYVGLGLNQSSIGVWENVYPYAPVDQFVDLGTSRRIRSDEWKVHTPWVLNQALASSPVVNPNVGGQSSPLLASVPVSDAIGLPQLKYAGFRFLDIERGFSWGWAYKSFALTLSFLWLCLILTRGNLPASLVGTLWIYFSSYTQWWFSSNLPEIMTAFAFGTIGALYTLYSTNRLMMGVGAALIAYAATNLILNLYPPFIISLGYLAAAIVAGYGLETRTYAQILRKPVSRALACAMALATVAIYGFQFHQSASGTIEAVLDTVYPGQRVSSSGAVPAVKVMDGFFEMFRVGEDNFPRIPSSYNASEASGHVLMLPLLVLIVPLTTWFRRDNALLLTIAGFCALAFAWSAVHLPGPLNSAMQAIGWASVTPKRAIMALGVGAILFSIVLLARMQLVPPSAALRKIQWVTIPLTVVPVLYFGWTLRRMDPAFFTWDVITLGALVAAFIAMGIARGSTRLVATGVAILALPAISVNPLVSGISSIMEKPVLVAARAQSVGPNQRWIVVGDNFFAQGLKAQGLSVFAGTNYLPDSESINRLDPAALHADVWNRYATIRIASRPGLGSPDFKLVRPDQYLITLDICSRAVRDIGITHVAYTVATPAGDLDCLEDIAAPQDSGVRLFKLKR